MRWCRLVSKRCLNEAVLGSAASLSVLFHDRRWGSAAIEPLKRLKVAVLADALRVTGEMLMR
jgi:hypothetical protein